jgi:CheY-like chemotaxis protein
MSHELRTPLNAVLGFAQLLDLEALTDENHDAVKQILKGGDHLLVLINEVLDLSRIETGDLALSTEAILVNDLLVEVVDLMQPLAVRHDVHLIGARQSTSAQYVCADRQRLKQILLNLLSNGVNYNRPGGTVAVSCDQQRAGRLRIKVTDTGPGIPAEHLALLFVPFERLGAERAGIDGAGIGLALSHRLAIVMGGAVGVETTVGHGSTFWVDLPLAEGPVEGSEQPNRAIPTADAPVARPERQRVLYIEDNLANLKLVQRVFAMRSDVEIIPSMRGRLGLELAREHRPVLILLDLHLPDVEGDEVLLELRNDPATASIPVVIISEDATPGQIQRLVSAGALVYLTKPFDVRELLRLVDDVLLAEETTR